MCHKLIKEINPEEIVAVEKNFRKVFSKVIEDHSSNKILSEQDLRAVFYYHLRLMLESEMTDFSVFLDFYYDVSFGSWGKGGIKPDLILISTKESHLSQPLAVAEFKTEKAGKEAITKDIQRLGKMKKQYGAYRGYFIGITKKDLFDHIGPILNMPIYRREGTYQLKKNMEWVNDYLHVFSYSFQQSKVWEVSFSNDQPVISTLK